MLAALGQVMLYVDGMSGVMEHPATLQWLYSLIASRFRLVVKTALKLLLVFIEYTDSNSLLLIRAVHAVDSAEGEATSPCSGDAFVEHSVAGTNRKIGSGRVSG